jgi:4-amino-4-deoxychorismate lyase
VFETALVVDGKPRELGPHLDRLYRSAGMADLELPGREVWERMTRVAVDNWTAGGEFAVKLVATRGTEFDNTGPTVYAIAFPVDPPYTADKRRPGIEVAVLDRGFDPLVAERAPWLLLGAKTLSYAMNMAALREADRLGVDEVLFRADDGTVLEAPQSTLVVAEGRTLRTPPASSGVLPGTTQKALYRAAEKAGWSTKVEPVHTDELPAADALFLISSVRRIRWIHTLDGTPLKNAVPLWEELDAIYEAEYA